MTGSTLGLVITSIVTVIVLAAWLVLVFYADAHPGWRRRVSSGHGIAGQAALAAARRQDESADGVSHQTAGSATARPDAGASAEPAAGTAPDKARAG